MDWVKVQIHVIDEKDPTKTIIADSKEDRVQLRPFTELGLWILVTAVISFGFGVIFSGPIWGTLNWFNSFNPVAR